VGFVSNGTHNDKKGGERKKQLQITRIQISRSCKK
jgi:hypothetical protein